MFDISFVAIFYLLFETHFILILLNKKSAAGGIMLFLHTDIFDVVFTLRRAIRNS